MSDRFPGDWLGEPLPAFDLHLPPVEMQHLRDLRQASTVTPEGKGGAITMDDPPVGFADSAASGRAVESERAANSPSLACRRRRIAANASHEFGLSRSR